MSDEIEAQDNAHNIRRDAHMQRRNAWYGREGDGVRAHAGTCGMRPNATAAASRGGAQDHPLL